MSIFEVFRLSRHGTYLGSICSTMGSSPSAGRPRPHGTLPRFTTPQVGMRAGSLADGLNT